MSRDRDYTNPEEKVAGARARVRTYLQRRGEAVSRDELLSVASKAGLTKSLVYDALLYIRNLEDPEDIDIANWFGYGNMTEKPSFEGEPRRPWFIYYDLDPEWKQAMVDGWLSFEEE